MGLNEETKRGEQIEEFKKSIEELKKQVEKTEETKAKTEALFDLSQISKMLSGKIEKGDIEKIKTLIKEVEGLLPTTSSVVGGILKEVDSILKMAPGMGLVSDLLGIGKEKK